MSPKKSKIQQLAQVFDKESRKEHISDTSVQESEQLIDSFEENGAIGGDYLNRLEFR